MSELDRVYRALMFCLMFSALSGLVGAFASAVVDYGFWEAIQVFGLGGVLLGWLAAAFMMLYARRLSRKL